MCLECDKKFTDIGFLDLTNFQTRIQRFYWERFIQCRYAYERFLWDIRVKIRLLTNFLRLPDRLICLSRIDQAERFAWYQACLILIRQQPDRSGCRLILIWHVPDRSGIAWYQAGKWCLICLSRIFDPAPKIRQSGKLAWYVKNLRLA